MSEVTDEQKRKIMESGNEYWKARPSDEEVFQHFGYNVKTLADIPGDYIIDKDGSELLVGINLYTAFKNGMGRPFRIIIDFDPDYDWYLYQTIYGFPGRSNQTPDSPPAEQPARDGTPSPG